MWIHARYYFFYFAALGLVSPYFGWWLGSTLSPQDATYVLAAFQATLILAPSIWGRLAFSGDRPGHWLSHGTLGAAIFALGLTQITSATPVGASIFVVIAFGVFFNAILPHAESMVYLDQEGDQAKYSRIRIFGSLGFLTCSMLVGGGIVMSTPSMLPSIVTALLLGAWLCSMDYKKRPAPLLSDDPDVDSNEAWLAIVWPLWPLWCLTAATQASFACYYAFFALHMTALGFPSWSVGALIGVSVLAEIVAFWHIDWFFKRWTPWTWLQITSMASLLRWAVYSIADDSPLGVVSVVVLQMTHAIGFSVFHTACLKLIYEKYPSTHNGAVQGFYNSVGYGVGGLIGVSTAGFIWTSSGHTSGIFTWAAILSGLAFVAAWVGANVSRHSMRNSNS